MSPAPRQHILVELSDEFRELEALRQQALAKRTATGSPGTKEVKKQLRRWAKRLG